jgi:hypothetical protein
MSSNGGAKEIPAGFRQMPKTPIPMSAMATIRDFKEILHPFIV